MENHWTDNRSNKYMEDRTDRDRARYNPINWTCSLKWTNYIIPFTFRKCQQNHKFVIIFVDYW